MTAYAFQGYDEKTMARAMGRSLSISTKKSVEVSKWIKGKSVAKAKDMLQSVIALKNAVPYRRYNQELAHQTSVGSGGYPVKVCEAILALVEAAEANATNKGLNTSHLTITHVCAHLGSRPMRYGRKRRVQAKRTHVELVVQESAEKKLTAKEAKKVVPVKDAKAEKKSEPAKVEKKEKPEVEAKEVEQPKQEKTEVKEEKTEEKKVEAPAEEKKDDAQ
jgi:large subunit ribosomal protein L22